MVSKAIYNGIGIISGLVNLISLVLNIVAIINLCKLERRMKLAVNVTLISLSVDNILQSTAAQIFVTSSCFLKKWGWDAVGCHFYAAWTYWLALTAIYLKVLLAWQHFSVARSRKVNRSRESLSKRARPVSVCAIVALVWCTPPIFGWSSFGLEGISISCSLNWHINDSLHLTYNCATMAVAFLVPLLFIAVTYVRLCLFIKRNSFAPDSQKKDGKEKTIKILVKVGLAVTLTFFLTWSPYAVVSVLAMAVPELLTPLTKTIPSILAKTSTLALPMVYLLVHKEYRMETMKVIARIRRKSKPSKIVNSQDATDECQFNLEECKPLES